MKTKTIYLLRHGETEYNKMGMVQGRGINASLNEKGQEQAKLVTNYFADKHIESIYCSSLIRTEETVKGLGLPITRLAGFDEISWGTQEGIVPDKEALGMYWDTLEKWKKGELHVAVGGGETPIEVMERQREAMKLVMEGDESTVLICMHGRAIRILLSWLLNYSLIHMDSFTHQNCSVYELKFTSNSFRIGKYNYVRHLLA